MSFKSKTIKPLITVDKVLELIDSESLFEYYLSDIIEDYNVNEMMQSPLRPFENPDLIRSFGIFKSVKYNDLLLFKDLATGDLGNAVVLVKRLFHYDTLFDACSRICIDFNITDYGYPEIDYTPVKTVDFLYKNNRNKFSKVNIKIQIKLRKWDRSDKEFWSSYGISLRTLKRYRVKPITHFFLNETPNKCIQPAYAYFENKDNEITYKIYQPRAEKKLKWRGNVGYDIWQGWTQLPDEGKLLIITKSYKDIMSIDDVCGYNSVSPQSESTHPKEYVVDELKKRFNKIVVLFDNDFDNPENPGRLNAIKFCEKYNLPMIEIPDSYQSKDFSDLVKYHGQDEAKEVLTKLLKDGGFI